MKSMTVIVSAREMRAANASATHRTLATVYQPAPMRAVPSALYLRALCHLLPCVLAGLPHGDARSCSFRRRVRHATATMREALSQGFASSSFALTPTRPPEPRLVDAREVERVAIPMVHRDAFCPCGSAASLHPQRTGAVVAMCDECPTDHDAALFPSSDAAMAFFDRQAP